MRALPITGLCLLATLTCIAPVSAGETPDVAVPAAIAVPTPISTPQAIVAAQNAQTLGAVAAMRSRLAEIVPMQPRKDAIAQSAASFAAHWGDVAASYAETQMQMVDTMIIGLNAQHELLIHEFLNSEPMVTNAPLFADSQFTIPTDMPINFTNPPLINAGFFGS